MANSRGDDCRICRSPTELFGHALILGRHQIDYHRCSACGFVQTEQPFWLPEAYGRVINDTDVGLVSRNLVLSIISRSIIRVFFDAKGRFLDFAGGYGLLVRLMRDAGFDFYHHDPYCSNLFAKGFEADLAKGPFELVTAFEVIEHLEDPVGSLRAVLESTDSVLVGTEVLPSPAPKPGEWWYYGVEHGQHISIFGMGSLNRMAAELDVHMYSNGSSLHLFTRRRLPGLGFALLARYRVARLLGRLTKRASLQASDFERALGGTRHEDRFQLAVGATNAAGVGKDRLGWAPLRS